MITYIWLLAKHTIRIKLSILSKKLSGFFTDSIDSSGGGGGGEGWGPAISGGGGGCPIDFTGREGGGVVGSPIPL